jgi:DNA-binding NarL/FixJ family response regulator
MEGSEIIPIALAGDYALNLHALATLLRPENGFRVVSINRNKHELEDNLVRGGKEQAPGIVLLDINFDLHRAVGIISFLKTARPAIRVAALGLTRDPAAIQRLSQWGVTCYIPKNSEPGQLRDALRKLADNANYTTPAMKTALDGIVAGGTEREPVGDWPDATASEQRFFRLALSDRSDEDIRRKMNLCPSTFMKLAAKVYRLFGVRSRDGLVLALYRIRFVIRDDL